MSLSLLSIVIDSLKAPTMLSRKTDRQIERQNQRTLQIFFGNELVLQVTCCDRVEQCYLKNYIYMSQSRPRRKKWSVSVAIVGKTSLAVPDDLRSCFAGVLIMKLIQLKDQRGLLPVPFPVSRDLVTKKKDFHLIDPYSRGKTSDRAHVEAVASSALLFLNSSPPMNINNDVWMLL